MRRPDRRSLIEGGVVVGIGVVILVLLPSQVSVISGLQTEMSPAFIPALVGVGLLIAGAGLVIQSAVGRASPKAVELDRTAALRVVVSVLLLIAYTILFPRFGFVVTSAVFIGILTYLFGARDWMKIALVVVLTPVGVWLFFEKLFRIPLPHGLLF